MKYEWKKQEKDLYLPKTKPVLVMIPNMKYFTISGKGDPNNNPDFQARISVLYSLSYTLKMLPKSDYTPAGYFGYTVYPLEGIWDLDEKGKKSSELNKDNFIYKLMIRQPDFVNEEIFNIILAKIKKKGFNPKLEEVKFEEIEDGLGIQMLHIGPYDNEVESFEKMKKYMEENGYKRRNFSHKEIYLSNFLKTKPEKLKTVLRYFVEKQKT